MLSFVIVTWNCKKQIQDCLESLQKQPDFGGFETIIIDEASNDGTADYLRSVAEQFNLRLICRTTKGNWAINNHMGVSMAKGDWIAVSNPDIVFPAGSLNQLISEAEYLSKIYPGPKPFIGCQLVSTDGSKSAHPIRQLSLGTIFHAGVRLGVFLDRKLWRGYFRRRFYYDPESLKGPSKVDHLNASFFMVHRDTVASLGKLWGDEYRWACADSDMFMRAKSKFIGLIFYPEIQLIHEGAHSRKFTPKPEYDYEFTYGYLCYAKAWNCHPNALRILLMLDILFTPLLLSAGRFDNIKSQMKCSAARLKAVLE